MMTRREFIGGMAASLGGLMLAGCGDGTGVVTAGQTGIPVLNLSTDLEQFGVTNMAPDLPARDSTPLFAAGLQIALNNGIRQITADRGTYWFKSLAGQSNNKSGHIFLDAITAELLIDLQGSSLIFAIPNASAILIVQCSNVALRNFTIDFSPLPFSQVTVRGAIPVQTTKDGDCFGTATVGLQDGFPALTSFPGANPTFAFAYRAADGNARNWDTPRFVASVLSDAELQLWSFREVAGQRLSCLPVITGDYFKRCVATIQEGDTLEVSQRTGSAAIEVVSSSRITLSSIGIYSGYVQGIFCMYVSSSLVQDCFIKPGAGRLGSVNADGITFFIAGSNIEISGNRIISPHDDSIALASSILGTVSSTSGAQFEMTLSTRGNQSLLPGSNIVFLSATTAAVLFSTTVISAAASESGITVFVQDILPESVVSQSLVAWNDPSHLGGGSRIINNCIAASRFAKGIFLNGETDVLIQGNYIQETSYAGIYLTEWLQSDDWQCGPNSNITIRNNVLELANSQLGGITPLQLGAIQVYSINAQGGEVSTEPNSGIIIRDNFIAETPRTGLWYKNVSSGLIQNNVFQRTSQQPAVDQPGPWNTPAFQAEFAQPQIVKASSVTAPTVTNDQIPLLYVTAPGGGPGEAISPGGTALATQKSPPETQATTISLIDSGGTEFNGLPIMTAAWPEISFLIPRGAATGAAVVTVTSGSQVARGGIFIG